MTFNMTLKAPIMQAVDTLNFWVFLLGIGNYSVGTVPSEISCSDGMFLYSTCLCTSMLTALQGCRMQWRRIVC